MLAAFLVISLLVGAQCMPQQEVIKAESLQPPAAAPKQPKEPQPLPQENAESPIQPPGTLVPDGGAPLPGNVAESPDAVERSGTADLDTDATFWGGYGGYGWGGYRPYYGYGWGSPWRRWGGYGYGGRGYGGWGGWGWGGRGWGWGGRGWGWGGRYWG